MIKQSRRFETGRVAGHFFTKQKITKNGKVYKKMLKNLGFSKWPARLREAERNPLPNRASSATPNTPSTATELGRDPDMLHNVPMGILLPPQPKVGEETLGRRIVASQKENMIIFHIYIYLCAIRCELTKQERAGVFSR